MQRNIENENRMELVVIPIDELKEMLRQVIKEELKEAKVEELQDRLLAPKLACKVFEPPISLVTLSAWEKQGLLRKIFIGGRTFYKYSELIESGKSLKKYRQHNKFI